jgi:hypothetical protein
MIDPSQALESPDLATATDQLNRLYPGQSLSYSGERELTPEQKMSILQMAGYKTTTGDNGSPQIDTTQFNNPEGDRLRALRAEIAARPTSPDLSGIANWINFRGLNPQNPLKYTPPDRADTQAGRDETYAKLTAALADQEEKKRSEQQALLKDLIAMKGGEYRFAVGEKQANPFMAKAQQQANITGYEITDPQNVMPTSKDAEEIKKATASLKGLQSTGVKIQDDIGGSSPLDRFGAVTIPFTDKKIGTEKGIALDSDLTDMVLQAKELANLGAITGPDMKLMESAMGNVTGLGSLVGGKERAKKQIGEIIDRAKTKMGLSATTRGYTPHQGYLDPPKSTAKKALSYEEWVKAGKPAK